MIALIAVPSDLRDALAGSQGAVAEFESGKALELVVGKQPTEVDAVVIGPSVRDPVQDASRTYRLDPTTSVVILASDGEQRRRIRAALRFAPLIGRDVDCTETNGATLDLIRDAAARARRRRNHQRMLGSLQPRVVSQSGQPAPLRERYAALLMGVAPIAIIATDIDHRVVSANAAATRILGKAERELLGLALGSEQLGADGGAWEAMLRAAGDEPSERTIIERKRPAGAPLILEARAVSVRDASGSGYLILAEDVTARVRLTAEREAALERAQEASRLKDEFLATVSHELRTPLNAILGWAKLLKLGLAPEKRERALETIERNALAQSQLIEDLLDITRITTGKLRLEVERTELGPIIESAIDTVRPTADAKQIRLTATLSQGGGTVLGDPTRLQQVVWNLLNNALKFSAKGAGHVRITLQRIDSYLELTVSDNGQGIAAEFLPHVFDSFRQADAAASRRHGGLGLGLTITKHIVEQHGGTIHASSAGVGTGASFVVRLPLAPVRPAPQASHMAFGGTAAPTPMAAPQELVGLRVLIVDDELDSRELLADLLTDCGAIVRCADSVARALEEHAAFGPNVLVSDIGMPGEDGYSLVAKIRALPRERGGAIPAAALTAYARAEDRRRALQAGFQMHVAKPVEPEELVTVVATLARMAKLLE